MVIGRVRMASSLATIAFGIPLFLDTWGTSFAVIMAGLPIGVLAGVIYNLIMAGTVWEISSAVFIGSSVLVAVMTWWFWTHGWVDVRKPASLVGAGVITGLVNALFVFPLVLALNIPPYAGTIGVYESFLRVLGNPVTARLATELVVERSTRRSVSCSPRSRRCSSPRSSGGRWSTRTPWRRRNDAAE